MKSISDSFCSKPYKLISIHNWKDDRNWRGFFEYMIYVSLIVRDNVPFRLYLKWFKYKSKGINLKYKHLNIPVSMKCVLGYVNTSFLIKKKKTVLNITKLSNKTKHVVSTVITVILRINRKLCIHMHSYIKSQEI